MAERGSHSGYDRNPPFHPRSNGYRYWEPQRGPGMSHRGYHGVRKSYRFDYRPYYRGKGLIRGNGRGDHKNVPTESPREMFETPRPLSPVEGTEEFTKLKIEHTSAIIMRQLLSTEEIVVNPPKNKDKEKSVAQKKEGDIAIRTPTPKKIKVLKKQPKSSPKRNEDAQNFKDYNVQEIHNKIINHITNMNDGKKKNLINATFSGYDEAIRLIQSQKRLQISRAFRSMCGDSVDKDATKESSNLINSIIPDVGIKIEDLPLDVIRSLRDTLCLDEEDDFFSTTNSYQYHQDFDFDICEEERQDHFSKLSEDLGASQIEKDNLNVESINFPSAQILNQISTSSKTDINPTGQLIRQESPPVRIGTENVETNFEFGDFNNSEIKPEPVNELDDFRIQIKSEPVDEYYEILNKSIINKDIFDKQTVNLDLETKTEPLDEQLQPENLIHSTHEYIKDKDTLDNNTLNANKTSSSDAQKLTEDTEIQPKSLSVRSIFDFGLDEYANLEDSTTSCPKERSVSQLNFSLNSRKNYSVVGNKKIIVDEQPLSNNDNSSINIREGMSQMNSNVIHTNEGKIKAQFKSPETVSIDHNIENRVKDFAKETGDASPKKILFLNYEVNLENDSNKYLTSSSDLGIERFFDYFKSNYGNCDTSELSSVVDKMHFIDKCVEKLTEFRRSLFNKLIKKNIINTNDETYIQGESSECKKRKLNDNFSEKEIGALNTDKNARLQENYEENEKMHNIDASSTTNKEVFTKNDTSNIQGESSISKKPKFSDSFSKKECIVLNTDGENSNDENIKNCNADSNYQKASKNSAIFFRAKSSNLITSLAKGVAKKTQKVNDRLNNINTVVQRKTEPRRFYNIKFSFISFNEKITQIKRQEDQLFLATERGQIYVCDLNTGTLVNTLRNGDGVITCLAILEQSKLYVGASSTLKIYCLKTLDLLKAIDIFPEDKIQCMDLQVHWGYLFVGCIEGTLQRFSIKTDASEYQDRSMNNIQAIKATQEGPRKVLIVGNRNAPICIRDALSGLILRQLSSSVTTTTYSLILHQNLVCCGTTSQSILVFKYQEGVLLKQLKVASKGISCMEQFKNMLFAGCTDGSIYVYQFHPKENKNLNLICQKKLRGGSILCMAVLPKQIIVKTMTNPVFSLQMPKEVLSRIDY